MRLSDEDGVVFNAATALARDLWAVSESESGYNTEPRVVSIALFRRLWSNHRAFALLWNDKRLTEAALVLRAGLEATICLAANEVLRDDFVTSVRQDACETIKKQWKMYEESGDLEMARAYKVSLQDVAKRLPPGRPPKTLSWADLARAGGVEPFYMWHRAISGVHAHVTGLSLLSGVIGADGEDIHLHEALQQTGLSASLGQMSGATLYGCRVHSRMLSSAEHEQRALTLMNQLNSASESWFASDEDRAR